MNKIAQFIIGWLNWMKLTGIILIGIIWLASSTFVTIMIFWIFPWWIAIVIFLLVAFGVAKYCTHSNTKTMEG